MTERRVCYDDLSAPLKVVVWKVWIEIAILCFFMLIMVLGMVLLALDGGAA